MKYETEGVTYEQLYIVGIGSSAGGFEALQKFLRNLVPHQGIAYVIAQHLDPNQPTLLASLLSKYTTLEVSMAIDGEAIRAQHIYICPPNKNIAIEAGQFVLTQPSLKPYPKPSVNVFFQSLAKEKQDKAIGIILSGSGSDGAKGVLAIKKAGGLVLSEDEGAKYYSMPKAAIDTGVADATLTPELLAEGLDKVIVDRNYYAKHYEIKNEVGEIFEILNKKIGVDFSSYKESTMLRRIIKRMSDAKAEGTANYIKMLREDNEEAEKLKNELLIIVTSFFRDSDSFDELHRHLRELIKNKLDNNIRVWVPACATGEEAYSIAILTQEILEELDVKKKVSIFATDVSDNIIQKARKQTYNWNEVNDISAEYLDKYFVKDQSGKFSPIKKLRESIIFSKHDVIKDPPFINIDLISCRNLLIYFDPDLQKRIFNIFYYSLRYYSLLFLGHSETVGSAPLFKVLSNKHKIYKKTNDLVNIDFNAMSYMARNKRSNSKSIQRSDKKETYDIDSSISKSLFDALASDGLVIDGVSNSILYYKGDTSNYIKQPSGVSTSDIFRLLKDYLILDFRVIYTEAKSKKKATKSKRIIHYPCAENKEYVTISIFPLGANKLGEDTLFVKFEKEIENRESLSSLGSNIPADPIDYNSVNILEDELVFLKERLQITIEELETSNEELQSSNEELQSTNEELQSTNEELETANEELQSTNEELQTTNEELQTINDEVTDKNLELEFSHKAFNSILTTLQAHILVIDENLNVLKYTDGISDFLEIGTLSKINLSSLVINSNLKLPNILEDIKYCLKSGKEVGYELSVRERVYWFSIKRMIFLSDIDTLSKNTTLILSFTDKTDMFEKDRLVSQHLKMASMGEMIGNISHQWRQPLNSLSLSKDYLVMMYASGMLNEEAMNEFDNQTSGLITYMSKTIDDFRNFFAPAKDKTVFSVLEAINEALLIASEKLKSHGIEVSMPEQSACKIYGYLNEFKQVVINIVNNACDKIVAGNMNNGEVYIAIRKEGDDVVLEISDNAGGIDESIINKIFDPYFTTKFKSQGTGLGLYMAKVIIEKNMQGSLTAANVESGACFTIKMRSHNDSLPAADD